jgi:mono/diheme cytochrome c family protein
LPASTRSQRAEEIVMINGPVASIRHVYRRVVCSAPALLFATQVLADGTGWFSAAQVTQGRFEYSQKCAVCHGAQLQGGGAPALRGTVFQQQWNGKTLEDFYAYVRSNMPLGQGGELDAQEYADIVAYILAQSGLPA